MLPFISPKKSLFRQLTLQQWVRWVTVSYKSMLVKSFALGLFSIISGPSIGYLLVRMCRGDTKIQNSGSTFGTRSQNIHLYIYTDSRWQDISTGVFVLYLEVKRHTITIFKSWQTCFLFLLIVKRSCSCHAIFSHDRKYCRFLRNRMKKLVGWPQVLHYHRYCMTAGTTVSAPQSMLVH